jgi:sulfatase modifying factor 1
MRLADAAFALGLAAMPWVPLAHAQSKPAPPKSPRVLGCPGDMVAVGGTCIDRYEAYVVELLPNGKAKAHSPFEPVQGLRVKAMNARGKTPQAHISRNEAELACGAAGKRLCADTEWLGACKGKRSTAWPYGTSRVVGRCNDHGTSSFNLLFGKEGQPPPQSEYDFDHLNDPRLNQMKGTLAKSGAFGRCKTTDGVFDMVGNLHEWTADPAGTFRGGYYLDVELNGLGCDYRTTAHHDKYHDYSTGFRCCKTPGQGAKKSAQGKPTIATKPAKPPKGRKGTKPAVVDARSAPSKASR